MSTSTALQSKQKSMGLFSRLMNALSERATIRATEKDLNKLTDRELDDIGITRAMIPEIARGHVVWN